MGLLVARAYPHAELQVEGLPDGERRLRTRPLGDRHRDGAADLAVPAVSAAIARPIVPALAIVLVSPRSGELWPALRGEARTAANTRRLPVFVIPACVLSALRHGHLRHLAQEPAGDGRMRFAPGSKP